MKSVAAHTVLLIKLVRYRVHICIIGHGLMERGVKYSHLRYLWQQLFHRLYTEQIGGIVQGGQLAQVPDALDHFVIHHAGLREKLAAVSDSMTYGLYLLKRLQDSVLRVSKKLQNRLDTFRMVGDGLGDHQLVLA